MNILILDDEQLARSELSFLIQQSPEVKQVTIYEAEDISSAENLLFRHPIDVIFLDISLSEENGFTLAERLNQLASPPLVVFATAYDHYAVQAFDAHAADYVLKPFEQSRVDKALARVKQLQGWTKAEEESSPASSKTNLLTLTLADRSVVVKLPDIVSASVEDGELTVSTQKETYTVKKTLNWFKERAVADYFLQIHRNTVVNLEMIREIQPWFNHTLLLIMANGDRCPVGRSYLKDLNQRLTL